MRHRSKLPDQRIDSGADGCLALVALTESGLPLIRRWLEAPHVARWWNPAEAGIAEIAAHLRGDSVAPFLMERQGRPVGYLQIYRADGDPFWSGHDLPRETHGIDLFIGESDAVGRGLGPRFLRLAVARLFAMPEVARIHIDPDPRNAAAIRAYEKAGFSRVGLIETPDGPALYMTQQRSGSRRAG
jgi:aminoglycoside 6'-N-acetyltransferase